MKNKKVSNDLKKDDKPSNVSAPKDVKKDPKGKSKSRGRSDYGSHIDRSHNSIEQDWAETEEDF